MIKSLSKAVLLLGTNCGNRMALLKNARVEIEHRCGRIIQSSSIYETASWGFEAGPFLNQVIIINPTSDPIPLLEKLLEIEIQLGRIRNSETTYSSRTIDLDILYFDAIILHSTQLIIPHPRLHLRRFTLAPLAEIMPFFIHPVFNKTHLELLEELKDDCEVSLFFQAD